MIELEEEDEGPKGSPAWMTTFADLMSILMCFFVLLLSFSEMDVAKYKQVAGSMRDAFGVQNEIRMKDIPKGTSIVAKEFSPGRPNPTFVRTVQQQSTNTSASSLDIRTPMRGQNNNGSRIDMPMDAAMQQIEEALREETEEAARELRRRLQVQIDEGNIEVENDTDSITVRIRERGSFASGSADIENAFLPIIPIIRDALKGITGEIAVEGHTDDIPIYNERFRSNWELSSQRALALAHELLEDPALDPARFMIVGYADTRPRVDNDSWLNRAQNRRVEVVIRRAGVVADLVGAQADAGTTTVGNTEFD